MRYLYILSLFAVVGCSSNDARIIEDVCVPANEDGGPALEDLAKAKGHDVEDSKVICRKWFKKKLKQFADDMKDFG